MNNQSQIYDVAIIGGGPVGLFLGFCLEKAGISYIILEKRSEPRPGSRSLGIHPVSLELFEKIDLADQFIRNGIQIQFGHAFTNNGKIGTLSFQHCPKPFNYILALPQRQTEALLEQALLKTNSTALVRAALVRSITSKNDHVDITFNYKNQTKRIKATYLVGCDGKNSIVRRQAGISFEGQNYPDTYVMGDFADNTDLESDAAIFLCDEGLIESFPLPNHYRRWVVKTDRYIDSAIQEKLTSAVFNRIGHSLYDVEHTALSSFGVQKFIAEPMVSDRIILCGDAAHVVSPIGGQGMNLGWLAAWDLAQTLGQIKKNSFGAYTVLNEYQKRRTYAAKNAIWRAEANMKLGRKTNFSTLRNGIVSLMLNTPLSQLMANIFTMRGIERWIV